MFVKICGLTDQAALDAAVEAGADALGFVFAESAREIAPERARELCRGLPATVLRVAVMQHPDPLRFAAVIDQFAPDWVQTDIADFAGLTVPAGTRGLPVLREGETVAADDLPARLVFEGRISGSGATADWQQAKSLSARTELILAGGLNADNIGAAIATVQPFGVDVSSGVEYERGRKDPRKIREFVARVRALES